MQRPYHLVSHEHIHLVRNRVIRLWDAMFPRKKLPNRIAEAEASPESGHRVKAPSLEVMELRYMNKDDANDRLLVLIGELLYKNQLLREAIASKDDVIDMIINHLMTAATFDCSCDVAKQLSLVRNLVEEGDVELVRRNQSCRQMEVDTYDLRVFEKRCAS